MENKAASGASAARHAVANALEEIGIEIPRRRVPPQDADIQSAALAWKYGAGGPTFLFEWNQSTFRVSVSGEILEGLKRKVVEAYPLFSAVHRTGNARHPHRFQLRLDEEGEVALFDGRRAMDFEIEDV